MKCSDSKTDNNTAKHTHLQRLNTADRSDGSFQNGFCNFSVFQNLTCNGQHCVDCCIHNEICNNG